MRKTVLAVAILANGATPARVLSVQEYWQSLRACGAFSSRAFQSVCTQSWGVGTTELLPAERVFGRAAAAAERETHMGSMR